MEQVFGVSVYNLINKTTYQLKSIIGSKELNKDMTFDIALDEMKAWIYWKLVNNKTLLAKIGDVKQDIFEEFGGIIIEITYSEKQNIWALRFKQPDTTVPARTWTTQVAIQQLEDEVIFETINMCAFPSNCEEPIPYKIPAFIKSINGRLGIKAPIKISNRPFEIKDENDIDVLYNLLLDRNRVLPVILLTQDNAFRNYSINQNELAKRTFGLAYVVLLPYELSVKWVERVGRIWAPYDGAIKTYLPKIDLKNDETYRHPIALRDKIFDWNMRTADFDNGFITFLNNFVIRFNSQDSRMFENTGIYVKAKHGKLVNAIEEAKKSDSNDKELIFLYQEENESLQEQIKVLKQDLEGKENDYYLSLCEIEELKEERLKLLNKMQNYEYAIKTKSTTEDTIPIYDNWDDMADWCSQYLPDKLVLSSKAKQAIKTAQYEDIGLAYKALLLYANEYRDMRMRNKDDDDLLEKYKVKLGELGLSDLGPPTTESRLGERSNIYTTYCDGSEYLMEHHIGKGTCFEPRYCLRIYATWDALNNRVIIGSIPGHLDTRQSN